MMFEAEDKGLIVRTPPDCSSDRTGKLYFKTTS